MEKLFKSQVKKLLPSRIIYLAAFFHFFGLLVLFRVNKKIISFNPFFWLLYCFLWWSTHTSLLTILAAGLIFGRRNKPTPTGFSQFVIFLATIYNLVVFSFCFYYLVSLGTLNLGGENFWLINLQLIAGHFIAPLLVLYYFFRFGGMELLWKKKLGTLFWFLLFPIGYFFYVLTLSRFYDLEKYANFSFHLEKKYPYFIFQGIVEKKKGLPVSFLIAVLVFSALFFLFFWLNKWGKKSN